MKKCTLPLLILTFFAVSFTARSQVKIGDNITRVNPNSLLELESTTKGLLLPRMSNDQINAMMNVPAGMLVFSTTDSALYLRRDTGWAVLAFKTEMPPATSADTLWKRSGNDIYNTNNGKVGIGTTTPFSQLSNTSNNTYDATGYGGNEKALNWQANGFGYAAMLSNSDDRGLLVKVGRQGDNALEVEGVNSGGNTISALTVKGDGSVGIGNSSPTTALDVNGTAKATNFSGNGAGITGLHVSQVSGAAPLSNPVFNGNVTATLFSGNGAGITGLHVSQVSGAAPIVNPSFQGNINYSGTLNMGIQYIKQTSTISGSSYGKRYATCPTGTKVIGGGGGYNGNYTIDQEDIELDYSGPYKENTSLAWEVDLQNNDARSRPIIVYAICAKVQ